MSVPAPTIAPTQDAARRRRAKFRQAIEQRAAELQPVKAPVEPTPASTPIPLSAKGVFVPEAELRAAEMAATSYPSIAYIQTVVASYFNVGVIDIKSARRQVGIVLPRHVAMWFAKQLTPLSTPMISGRFGDRDHSVVLYADRKISGLIRRDAALAQDVAKLFELITGTAQ